MNQRACALCLFLLVSTTAVQAEIVMVGRDVNGTLVPSNDPNAGRNLNPAPGGVGQYVGQFGNGSAVVIGSKYIVTAGHVTPSATFTFNNGGATPTTYHMSIARAGGEISVYQIADAGLSFSVYAPIYTKSDEVGKDLISVGYGVGRGVEVDTPGTSNLAGWNWKYDSHGNTVIDGKQSWGTNNVDSIAVDGNNAQFLQFAFDRKLDAMGNVTNPDEVIISDHDSGGGTFIKDGGVWKLAGINDTIDGVKDQAGNYVDSIFDARGFFVDNPADSPITGSSPVSMSSYSVRLSQSQYQDFLAPYVARAVPEPGSMALLAMGLGVGAVIVRRRRTAA